MLESTPYYAATWLKVNSLGPSIKCFEVTEKKELLGWLSYDKQCFIIVGEVVDNKVKL